MPVNSRGTLWTSITPFSQEESVTSRAEPKTDARTKVRTSSTCSFVVVPMASLPQRANTRKAVLLLAAVGAEAAAVLCLAASVIWTVG
jgi:hypothetical protein